jgi:hypothetical protein
MRSLALVCLLSASTAFAGDYLWRPTATATATETLEQRIPPPAGATRVQAAPGSFGAWLRGLPMKPAGAAVHLFDGREKPRQDVHHAVVDIDVGNRDLQQCADAVMRLRAEYLRARGRRVAFHPDPEKPREIAWAPSSRGDEKAWKRFLVRLFADAGTASLAAEMARVKDPATLAPGDVLIQGGYPGHALIVLDVAVAADGRRLLLLGQSYMPAQELHVVKNLGDAALSPWYDAARLAAPGGLATPEWRPFTVADLRRFRD